MSTCRHCGANRTTLSTVQLSLRALLVGATLGGLATLIYYAGFVAGAVAAMAALDTYTP